MMLINKTNDATCLPLEAWFRFVTMPLVELRFVGNLIGAKGLVPRIWGYKESKPVSSRGERIVTTALAQTPLHDWHASHGGRMVDFAGWSMPIQYKSIVEEHVATRTAASLFDVSHMGRFRFRGTGVATFLDRLLTRRVLDMTPGKIRYSLVTNEKGGILDDVLVYRLTEDDEYSHAMVVNASNREKIADWISSQLTDADDVVMGDQTVETAMIAAQGPKAIQIVQPLVKANILSLDYYTGTTTSIGSSHGMVSRTGYTGEDGCELIVPADDALSLWQSIIEAGQDQGIKAAGLGARDTLRLEAAMPLYGHELSEEINPFQAGLRFAVNLKDRDFIGRDALLKLQSDVNQLKRVGLKLSGRRAAREGYSILTDDDVVGEVTSGTFSPTLDCPIAMGYVRQDASEVGTSLQVDIRGRLEPATVLKLPFYSRKN